MSERMAEEEKGRDKVGREEEEQEVEEGEAIPMEVIKSFLQKKEETTLRRQELRLQDFSAV